MNPFSQTRILPMYLILISEGWTWVGLSPPQPLSSLPSLVSFLPSRSGARIARGNFPFLPPSLPPSLFSQIFLPSPLQPPSPSSPPPTPHPLSPLPFILSAPSLTLQSFWTWVSNWKCVYQQANSDGRKIVAHSGIEPDTSIKQFKSLRSPNWAIPTDASNGISLIFIHYWPEYKYGSSTHQGLSTYQVWSFWGKVFLSYQFHNDEGDQHTDRQTDGHVQRNMPSFFEGGGGHNNWHM